MRNIICSEQLVEKLTIRLVGSIDLTMQLHQLRDEIYKNLGLCCD